MLGPKPRPGYLGQRGGISFCYCNHFTTNSGQSGRVKGVEEVSRLVVELSDLQRAFHVFGCQFLCRQLVNSTTCLAGTWLRLEIFEDH